MLWRMYAIFDSETDFIIDIKGALIRINAIWSKGGGLLEATVDYLSVDLNDHNEDSKDSDLIVEELW